MSITDMITLGYHEDHAKAVAASSYAAEPADIFSPVTAYVYWADEFKLWEVWTSDSNVPSEYFHRKLEAIEYALCITQDVEIGKRF